MAARVLPSLFKPPRLNFKSQFTAVLDFCVALELRLKFLPVLFYKYQSTESTVVSKWLN